MRAQKRCFSKIVPLAHSDILMIIMLTIIIIKIVFFLFSWRNFIHESNLKEKTLSLGANVSRLRS